LLSIDNVGVGLILVAFDENDTAEEIWIGLLNGLGLFHRMQKVVEEIAGLVDSPGIWTLVWGNSKEVVVAKNVAELLFFPFYHGR
jgi:hypothetical protein